MDWMEKQSCLRCNKGGKLLVCNEKVCPIVVHKKCLGCRAQFDDAGNFSCPYCVYKRVTEEMCQLRDKAMLAKEVLSTFIEEEMADGDTTHKRKTRIAEKKQPTSSAVAGNGSFSESKNNLESDDFQNHAVHLEEHQLEERSPTCISTPLRCEETDGLILDKQSESALLRCSQNSGLNDCGNSMMMVVYQPHLKPAVACDGDHVHCEEITKPEPVQVAKRVNAEHLTEVDECQDENVATNHAHARHLSPMPVEEDTVLNYALILSNKRTRKYSLAVKEKESRIEDDNMQEQVQKTTVSLAPELQLQSKFNKGVDTLSARFRHLKNQRESELQNLNHPRRFKAVSSAETNSRQVKQPSEQLTNSPFLNAKRSKKFWTHEEEDMLKEGVQKFSTTVNKNLPWRKILDFGRHVFDASRTPADLKDKWRKM